MMQPPNLSFPALEPEAISSCPAICRQEAALFDPARQAHEAAVPPRVILTFTRPDYRDLCRLVQAPAPWRHIWGCEVRQGRWQDRALTVVAPAPGAPYAAMVLEKLIALEARLVLALAWCGSLQPRVGIGSLVLPGAAVPGDGTSRHYVSGEPQPDPGLLALLQSCLEAGETPWQTGRILSTDALYRETPSLVKHYQGLGVLGIDLELAALFAVGQYRRVPVAALAAVSDELGDLTFRDGSRTPKFRQAREAALAIILEVATRWEGDHA